MGLMVVGVSLASTTSMLVGSRSLQIRKETIILGIRMRMHPTLMLLEGMIVLHLVERAMEDKFIAQQALVTSRIS
jgi:hypothetical protein